MISTRQKVILITGTSKGIGKYLAKYYLDRGMIVLGCSRTPSGFQNPNYKHYCLNICDENQVLEMFSDIKNEYERLDYLINNAAVNPSITLGILVSLKTAKNTMETNFIGTFLMSREASKLMMQNSFGRIINFSSMAVRHEVPGESIYTASKAAVVAFTRVFANEVFKLGITCNVVSPSAIETDLLVAVDPASLNHILNRNAINSLGRMEDVSNVIDWLIKPGSNTITGQIVNLGGV